MRALLSHLFLGLLILSVACSSAKGEECDDEGKVGGCEDGLLCAKQKAGAAKLVCLKACVGQEDCGANEACNGVAEDGKLKACQLKG